MANPAHVFGPDRPGSRGEHLLQRLLGSDARAAAFYDKQVLDHLNPRMRDFIARQEMAFIATADGHGECDCTFRAGPPGFICVIDDRTLAYPEYHGNGVMASMGNIVENGHVGILMVDFFEDLVGLHVNGRAQILGDAEAAGWDLPHEQTAPRRVERWIAVRVEEAYIHCAKNIPLLMKEDRRAKIADRSVRPAGSGYFTGEKTKSALEPSSERSTAGTQSPSEPIPDRPALPRTPVPQGRPISSTQAPPL
ncbi:pyridoxamine 5'-phosphate oxidase family protein [Actinoallomurus sp. CA-142502]|uniref:pyridoxamine 5'-phosphate oxidase family protein n=1 Tax=Actinoallomurus sp. CA-142502 TaxID=3239885 RepID=UPI003D934AF2